jgi:DNA-binding NarL/FixJ family response regulator
VNLYVLDPHTIYRRGLAACLELLEGVESVGHAPSVREAWEDPALFTSALVLVDQTVDGGSDFIAAVKESTAARVIVCSSDCEEEALLRALRAGATGFLRKDTLTTDGLAAAVTAAANGTGVVTPELLGKLRGGATEPLSTKAAPTLLTDREQQVLALIAEGHPTREVAQQLCYSERTVKNVLHDVVTKLNARSRSQAVAYAVREGLI